MDSKSGPFQITLRRGRSPAVYTGEVLQQKRGVGGSYAAVLEEEVYSMAELNALPQSDAVASSTFLRMFDCKNYNTCLSLAAALNWNSFTCFGCDGKCNRQLLWRAHNCVKNDRELADLCELPKLDGEEDA